jgi:hypothetical protein
MWTGVTRVAAQVGACFGVHPEPIHRRVETCAHRLWLVGIHVKLEKECAS